MTTTLWQRIEASRERWDVLRHPFYRRWSAGELTAEDLAAYSGQYRHAVTAVAEASHAVARALPSDAGLAGHAAEERAHIELWDGFVRATGGSTDAEPTPETAACVSEWTAGDDALDHLARLYAIESGQPEISKTKHEGLVGLYGFEEGPATDYFRVHADRDAEHAAEARELIERLASDADEDRIAAAAESAFRANWRLLDGV